MPIDNLEAGKQFAKAARMILAGSMDAGESTYWFDYKNMIDICERFKIVGAFNCYAGHWRLVLGVNEDRSMKVYDPRNSEEGSQIYTLNTKGPFTIPSSVTIPSIALQNICRHDPSKMLIEEARLDMLKENNYRLNLPRNFENTKLQEDGHNCGPLVLYAALVGDKHTPEFEGIPDFRELRAATGITIL